MAAKNTSRTKVGAPIEGVPPRFKAKLSFCIKLAPRKITPSRVELYARLYIAAIQLQEREQPIYRWEQENADLQRRAKARIGEAFAQIHPSAGHAIDAIRSFRRVLKKNSRNLLLTFRGLDEVLADLTKLEKQLLSIAFTTRSKNNTSIPMLLQSVDRRPSLSALTLMWWRLYLYRSYASEKRNNQFDDMYQLAKAWQITSAKSLESFARLVKKLFEGRTIGGVIRMQEPPSWAIPDLEVEPLGRSVTSEYRSPKLALEKPVTRKRIDLPTGAH